MRKKDEEIKKNIREKEDATKYGEFVSSYFGWITPNNQRKRAEKLENITDAKKKK